MQKAIEDVAKSLTAEAHVDAKDFSKLVVIKNIFGGSFSRASSAMQACAPNSAAARPIELCSVVTEAIRECPSPWTSASSQLPCAVIERFPARCECNFWKLGKAWIVALASREFLTSTNWLHEARFERMEVQLSAWIRRTQ